MCIFCLLRQDEHGSDFADVLREAIPELQDLREKFGHLLPTVKSPEKCISWFKEHILKVVNDETLALSEGDRLEEFNAVCTIICAAMYGLGIDPKESPGVGASLKGYFLATFLYGRYVERYSKAPDVFRNEDWDWSEE